MAMKVFDIPSHAKPPEGIELKPSKVDKRQIGAWCLNTVKQGSLFGPFKGDIVYENDRKKIDFRFAWEVYDLDTSELIHIVNATDPGKGNWTRFVNCARYLEEQNLVSIQEGMEVYYKAIRDIPAGEELLTWFERSKIKENRKVNSPDGEQKIKGSGSPKKLTGPGSPKKLAGPSPKKRKPKRTKSDSSLGLGVDVSIGEKRQRKKKKLFDDEEVSISDLIPKKRRKRNSRDSLSSTAESQELNIGKAKSLKGVSNVEDPSVNKKNGPKGKKGNKATPDSCPNKIDEEEEKAKFKEIEENWRYPSGINEYQFELISKFAICMNNRRMYKCDICGGLYRHTFSLKRHYLRNHINCSYLSKADITNCMIVIPLQHLGTLKANEGKMLGRIARQLSKTMQSGDENDKLPGLYRCNVCSKLFDEIEELVVHTKDHPELPDAKTFACSLCNMTFRFKMNLVRHQLVHEGKEMPQTKKKKPKEETPQAFVKTNDPKKPYGCSQCSMKFKYSTNLVKHKVVHSDDRPCQCTVCGKSFPTQTNLKKHMNIHIGCKVPCKYCDVIFSHVGGLRKHIRISHPEIHRERLLKLLEKRGKLGSKAARALENSYASETSSALTKKNVETRPKEENDTDKEVKVKKEKKTKVRIDDEIDTKFKYACTVCKKRFTEYVNMCRHRRIAHKNQDKPTETAGNESGVESREEVNQDVEGAGKTAVDDDPVAESMESIAEFYANVAYNIAENLNSYIDGGQDALANSKSHFKFDNFSPENFQEVKFDREVMEIPWDQYNFPQNYNPTVLQENFEYCPMDPDEHKKYQRETPNYFDVSIDESSLDDRGPALCTRRRSSRESKDDSVSRDSFGGIKFESEQMHENSTLGNSENCAVEVKEEKFSSENHGEKDVLLADDVKVKIKCENDQDHVMDEPHQKSADSNETEANDSSVGIGGDHVRASETVDSTDDGDNEKDEEDNKTKAIVPKSPSKQSDDDDGDVACEEKEQSDEKPEKESVEVNSGVEVNGEKPEEIESAESEEVKGDEKESIDPVADINGNKEKEIGGKECEPIVEEEKSKVEETVENGKSADESQTDKETFENEASTRSPDEESMKNDVNQNTGCLQDVTENLDSVIRRSHDSESSDGSNSGILLIDLFEDSDSESQTNDADTIFHGLDLAKGQVQQYGKATVEKRDENSSNSPQHSPLHNFDSFMFGKNGDVAYVCSVCKRHYPDFDRLIRHQWKKHPSINCHFLEVEQGHEIESLYYSRPCSRGLLGATGKALESAINRSTYTCSRCKSTFKSVDRLRVHIINCATPMPSPKKRKYRKRTPTKFDVGNTEGSGIKEHKLNIKELNARVKELSESRTEINSDKTEKSEKEDEGETTDTNNQKKEISKNNVVSDVSIVQKKEHNMDMKVKADEPASKPKRKMINRKRKASSAIKEVISKETVKSKRKKSTDVQYNPRNHIRRRELTEVLDKQQCKGCGVKFKTISLLERHVKKCDEKEKFKDIKVMKSTVNEMFHQKQKHTCIHCSKAFIYPKTLMNHYRAFCFVKKEKEKKGLLSEEDRNEESSVMTRLKQQEEDRKFTNELSVVTKGPKKGWPRGVKRKNRRKNHSWTYIKKRKSSGNQAPAVKSRTGKTKGGEVDDVDVKDGHVQESKVKHPLPSTKSESGKAVVSVAIEPNVLKESKDGIKSGKGHKSGNTTPKKSPKGLKQEDKKSSGRKNSKKETISPTSTRSIINSPQSPKRSPSVSSKIGSPNKSTPSKGKKSTSPNRPKTDKSDITPQKAKKILNFENPPTDIVSKKEKDRVQSQVEAVKKDVESRNDAKQPQVTSEKAKKGPKNSSASDNSTTAKVDKVENDKKMPDGKQGVATGQKKSHGTAATETEKGKKKNASVQSPKKNSQKIVFYNPDKKTVSLKNGKSKDSVNTVVVPNSPTKSGKSKKVVSEKGSPQRSKISTTNGESPKSGKAGNKKNSVQQKESQDKSNDHVNNGTSPNSSGKGASKKLTLDEDQSSTKNKSPADDTAAPKSPTKGGNKKLTFHIYDYTNFVKGKKKNMKAQDNDPKFHVLDEKDFADGATASKLAEGRALTAAEVGKKAKGVGGKKLVPAQSICTDLINFTAKKTVGVAKLKGLVNKKPDKFKFHEVNLSSKEENNCNAKDAVEIKGK